MRMKFPRLPIVAKELGAGMPWRQTLYTRLSQLELVDNIQRCLIVTIAAR